MEEFRFRPLSDYMHTASLEHLYALTKHWESDLEFYKDELKFFNDLIGKYFLFMTREENMEVVQKMQANVIKLDKDRENLIKRMQRHVSRLSQLMGNQFSNDEHEFRNEHQKLENDITTFTKEFRKVKKEVFAITEHVIESERLQHLLTA